MYGCITTPKKMIGEWLWDLIQKAAIKAAVKIDDIVVKDHPDLKVQPEKEDHEGWQVRKVKQVSYCWHLMVLILNIPFQAVLQELIR